MRLPGWLCVGRRLAKALVGAALVGFVTANLGLPLIVPVNEVASHDAAGGAKDKSVPFPCQDRPCGCMSAEACMRSCCCFSAAERLAWFRARNITPLPELIASAKAEGHCAEPESCPQCVKVEQKPAPRACCATKKTNATTCNAPAAIATAAQGADLVAKLSAANESSLQSDPSKSAEPARKGWRVVVVIGSFAAHCHGMGPWSLTGVLAIPPSAEVAYAFDWNRAEDVSTVAPRLLSAIHSPPTRPPCC